MFSSDELRSGFLRFFESKGHRLMPSSSLVPQGDPTLLLTSAGMVPFKPYFMGELPPPHPRLASCQKCFRTTDIDTVGDTKHLTFFEMLGNFSIGDYFKEEAIAYAWEFATRELELPLERLWVTIYLDDEQAFAYWKALGVPPERIVRHGEEDNFWGPAGEEGPCGPCSEIHYDLGPEWGCGKPDCLPGCDCPRFVEIWNLVFTQYYHHRDGSRTPLPRKNIDTGMGLERVAAILQGKPSFYETDLFLPLISLLEGLSGQRYGLEEARDRAFRVVAEHGRAAAFLIGDGVIPSNEGRGYVLRRVLRRASRFGRSLGLEKPFLAQVAREVSMGMKHLYPELERNYDFILKVIDIEEEKFQQTLATGLALLEKVIAGVKEKGQRVIPGDEVFRLYDTYGFPEEVTAEVVREQGLALDEEGFKRALERQRERARTAQKFGLGEKVGADWAAFPGTVFVGYKALSTQTRLLGLKSSNGWVERVGEGQEAEAILAQTPFYGEMGGQAGDAGEIRGPGGRMVVKEAVRPAPNIVLHRGQVLDGELAVGEKVVAEVDRERRLDIARNHTATHLLQAALRRVLGTHLLQAGSLMAPDYLRFDFGHPSSLSREEKEAVERLVNEKVRENLEVRARMVPYRQALEEGAIALFEEKYGETVRVVEIGSPPFSAELCGGTHLARTGEIGFFHILREGSIGSGLRRIEAVTGRGAEVLVAARLQSLEAMAAQLRTTPEEASARLRALQEEMERERKLARRLQRELLRREAEALLPHVERVDGVAVLAAQVEAPDMEALRETGDWLRQQLGSSVVVLAAVIEERPQFVAMVSKDLVPRGFHAGHLVQKVAALTGGSGGGRPELGQAGGKDKTRVQEALKSVAKIIGKR